MKNLFCTPKKGPPKMASSYQSLKDQTYRVAEVYRFYVPILIKQATDAGKNQARITEKDAVLNTRTDRLYNPLLDAYDDPADLRPALQGFAPEAIKAGAEIVATEIRLKRYTVYVQGTTIEVYW